MERVVSTWFSDNGEHPTNQSGIAATCATRGVASGVGLYVVTGACSGPCPACAQNSANVTGHVATTCSISSSFVHDAHYYYVVM